MTNDQYSVKDVPSCVLFDLDNTLVGIPNTWIYFDGLIQEVLKDIYHLPIPTPQERNQLWRSGKEYLSILTNWGVSDPDDFWIQFDQLDGKRRLKLIQNQQLLLFADVIPTLTKLADMENLKTGLVTNTPRFIAQHELDAYNLSQYFDAILGLGDDQMICKPEPDGILQVLDTLDCPAHKAIYIGDSIVDILAAKRAKVVPILIDRDGKKRDRFSAIEEKDFIRISGLKEIFDHIR